MTKTRSNIVFLEGKKVFLRPLLRRDIREEREIEWEEKEKGKGEEGEQREREAGKTGRKANDNYLIFWSKSLYAYVYGCDMVVKNRSIMLTKELLLWNSIKESVLSKYKIWFLYNEGMGMSLNQHLDIFVSKHIHEVCTL